MNRTQKEDLVAQLRAEFEAAESVILTSYQGIDVNTINELRQKFRGANVHYHTVKNSLARLALQGTDKEAMADLFTGPVTIAYSHEDPVAPAKIIKDFLKTTTDEQTFEIKGGILEGEVLDIAGVQRLADMPSKEDLQVQLLMLFNAGPLELLRTMSAGPLELLRVFEAKRMAEEAA